MLDLSEGQKALVDATDSLFAIACPGAGKTRAMVTRFLKRTAEEPRKGICLISFTNAAVDEVRRRCGSHNEALKAPNFVGTFDSFLHRFIVTPSSLSTIKSHRDTSSHGKMHQPAISACLTKISEISSPDLNPSKWVGLISTLMGAQLL